MILGMSVIVNQQCAPSLSLLCSAAPQSAQFYISSLFSSDFRSVSNHELSSPFQTLLISHASVSSHLNPSICICLTLTPCSTAEPEEWHCSRSSEPEQEPAPEPEPEWQRH